MSRMLFSACWVAALLWVFAATGFAQAKRPSPVTTKVKPQGKPLGNQYLADWYNKTQRLTLLSGKHKRWVYDHLYKTDTRSEGMFFFKAPDLGRIDFQATRVGKNDKSRKKTSTGRSYTVRPEPVPERWVCDGKRIIKIDDKSRQKQIFEIPKGAQGRNILNEPLPFLFGMPPKQARERFDLYLVRHDRNARGPGQVIIQAVPKRTKDKQNYREAMVILSDETYLPKAVRLISPTTKREEVYAFYDLVPNVMPRKGFFGQVKVEDMLNPPDTKGWPEKVHRTPKAVAQKPIVPRVIRFPWLFARQQLEKAGYRVMVVVGNKPPPNGKFGFVVYDQNPAGGKEITPGTVVKLTIYNGAYKPTANPDFRGWHWKSVQAVLKQSGIAPKFHRGVPAPIADLEYTAYAAKAVEGTKEVKLYLFTTRKVAEKK